MSRVSKTTLRFDDLLVVSQNSDVSWLCFIIEKEYRLQSAEKKGCLVSQMVKSLPAMQETWVWSWGQEDPLEKETATHSSILAWEIPWTEEPGGLQSLGSHRVGHDWATNTFTFRLQSGETSQELPVVLSQWSCRDGS